MIGQSYGATGITVWEIGRDKWHAEARFFDDGFAELGSSEGVIRTRYVGPLARVVDIVKADAERMGIRWSNPAHHAPCIYYEGDGENPAHPAPQGWRTRISAECERLGWCNIYKEQA